MTNIPKLSVKQLAEYLNSSSSRRKKILEQAKFPAPYIVKWHEKSRAAIIKHLSSEDRNLAALEARVKELKDTLLGGGFVSDVSERMARADYTVLESFAKNQNAMGLGGIRFSGWEGARPKNVINGVEIPIPVSLIQIRKIKDIEYCGGASMLLTASPEGEYERKRHGQLAASLIWRGLQDTGALDLPAHTKLCICIDPILGAVYEAPTAQARRQTEIDDACEEIRLRWPHI